MKRLLIIGCVLLGVQVASAQRGTTITTGQNNAPVVRTENKTLPVTRQDIHSRPLEGRGNGVRKCNKECHSGKLNVNRECKDIHTGRGHVKREDMLVHSRTQISHTNREVLRREDDTK